MSTFRFKQFEVIQEKNAMKVNTDSVILASWVKSDAKNSRILDIGTGTGLLALCMAQKHPKSTIHGIEIVKENSHEAHINFSNSKWSENLKAIHISLQDYTPTNNYKLIICNPPYFNNSSKNPNSNKTIARHTDLLSYKDIIDFCDVHLAKNGELSIILPFDEAKLFEEIAFKSNLYPSKKLYIKGNKNKTPNRICVSYIKEVLTPVLIQNLTVRTPDHQYTKEYIALTNNFYLNLRGE